MKIIFFILGFFPCLSFASFYSHCIYEAEVVTIEKLSRLNERTVGNIRTGEDHFVYVMGLNLKNGRPKPGSHVQDCQQRNVKVIFNKEDGYLIGSQLMLSIARRSSRTGSFSELISVNKKNDSREF